MSISISCSNPKTDLRKKLQLLDLCDDVLNVIMDFIVAKRHLVKCMYTCRKLYQLALPRVYKIVNISLRTNASVRRVGLTVASNPGLRLVKHITLWPWPDTLRRRSVLGFLRNFIVAVPQGQLEDFWWMCKEDLPANLAALLWQRQPYLETLAMYTRHNDLASLIPLSATIPGQHGKPSRVTELKVIPRDVHALDCASEALRRFEPASLYLDGCRYVGRLAARDADTGDVSDKVTETLFRHQRSTASIRVKWLGLRKLTLRDVDLRYCRQTWFQYLSLSELDFLELHYCDSADMFLFELVNNHAPRLKYLSFWHDLGAEQQDRSITALDDLLIATKGRLEELYLILRNVPHGEAPLRRVINSHRKTLRYLVHDMSWHGVGAPMVGPEHCEELVHGCSHLVGLALCLGSPTYDYVTFDAKSQEPFYDCLVSIMENVSLTSLNVLHHPHDYSTAEPYPSFASRMPLTERLAADIFKLSRETTPPLDVPRRVLEVVAFGQDEADGHFVDCFVEAETTCLHSTTKTAQLVSFHRLCEERLDYHIFNLDTKDWDKARRGRRNAAEDADDSVDLED